MTYLPPTGWANLATKDDIASLRAEVRGEIAELRGELKAQLPKLYVANVAAMMGLSGVIVGAAALLR
jgi:hypothetical protein